ncbi:MAG: DUF4920 domain-containing protein [Psychroflexus sp.]|nr:DUF4920 domain-containing protein [Psychroflexus sp.]
MKNLILIPLCLLFFNCTTQTEKNNDQSDKKETTKTDMPMVFYGDSIDYQSTKMAEDAFSELKSINLNDTLIMTFKSKVNAVCQKKGCWMQLDVPQGNDIKVTFKDYGFFVPKDISGQEVIIKGKGFLKEVSVEEQQHYAIDAGKSDQEIAAITEPKKEYRFIANGVAIPTSDGE